MAVRSRLFFALALLVLPTFAFAQNREDYPPLYKGPPLTKKETNQRDSLHHFLLGVLCEREDRLLEALKAYEKAAELDPEAPAVFKAQVAILIILERPADAIVQARKTLDLDPDDGEVSFVLARLYKGTGKYKEAIDVLESAATQPGLKESPAIAQQIHFDLGHLYETSEEFAKAAAAFARAADILEHPDRLLEEGPFHRKLVEAKAAEVFERIGHLFRKARQYDQALDAFKKAQSRLPEGAGRMNWNLAQVAAEQGQSEQALKFLDDYLRLQPLIMDPYQLKITLLNKLKRSAEIVPWLERAALADRHNVELRLLFARELARGGKTAQAEKVYQTLAEESPSIEVYRALFRLVRDDPTRGMVQVLFQLNKKLGAAHQKPPDPGAVSQAKAMIGAVRDDADLAKEIVAVAFRLPDRDDDLSVDTLHLLAALADRHRKNEEAEKFYRKCLKETTPGLEHLVYGGLLRTLFKSQKFEDIVKVCGEAREKAKATNHLLFYNEEAKALARLGRHKEALTQIDRAINLAGDQHVLSVKLTRVRILAQADRHAEAEKECQAMLKEFSLPGDVMEIRYILSSVYSTARQMAKAEEQLELVLKMDPNNPTANNDLGYIWADQSKHLDKAEEMIRRAIDLDRRQRKLAPGLNAEDDHDNAAYVDSLGWVLFRKGQFAEARRELEKAVKLPGGDDPTLWDHLGDVYFRLEMYGEARRAWEESLRLYDREHRLKKDDRHEEVRRKLKSLERVVGAK